MCGVCGSRCVYTHTYTHIHSHLRFWSMLLSLLRKKRSISFAGSCLCSNPCHYIHEYRFFFGHFFPTIFLVVCARPLSLTKVFLPPLSTRLVTGTRHFSCVRLYMCACDDADCFYYHSWRNNVVIAFGTLSSFCVCLCLCMWRCVKKETNCKKC